jgi:putative Holliday junction resolvase
VTNRGRLLAIDFGTVRHGLAVSDADRIVASPYDTYPRRDSVQDAAFFKKLVREESIVGLVVGLPLHTGGEEGIKAKEARAFAAWVGEATGLPVEMWDERCTTAAAEDALWDAGLSHKKRKSRRDAVAAQMILQGFIDAKMAPANPQAEG